MFKWGLSWEVTGFWRTLPLKKTNIVLVGHQIFPMGCYKKADAAPSQAPASCLTCDPSSCTHMHHDVIAM
jgi:hypothetical protein